MGSPAFSQLENLAGLAQSGVDVKPTLLRVLTDLYIQNAVHTSEEERQYVELALRLIDAVDPPTRTAIALKLADYPAAPRAIVERLVADGVSAPALPAPPVRAIAAPSPASATLGMSASDLTELFFRADAKTRKAILDNLADATARPAPLPRPDGERILRIERAVLGGRPGDFIRELEHALDIARILAERIVNDMSGEPLLVAAKAITVPIEVLQRILLFVNPGIGHSVTRVYALSGLYGEIGTDAASNLVALWRAAHPRAARSTEPVYVPGRGARERTEIQREFARAPRENTPRQRTT